MINRSHGLSLTRQAQLMCISRGSAYYSRKQEDKSQVQLMHSLDALHNQATPDEAYFAGLPFAQMLTA